MHIRFSESSQWVGNCPTRESHMPVLICRISTVLEVALSAFYVYTCGSLVLYPAKCSFGSKRALKSTVAALDCHGEPSDTAKAKYREQPKQAKAPGGHFRFKEPISPTTGGGLARWPGSASKSSSASMRMLSALFMIGAELLSLPSQCLGAGHCFYVSFICSFLWALSQL